MILPLHRMTQATGRALPLLALCVAAKSHAALPAQVTNPIARLARVFDTQLVKVEDRIEWLERQTASLAERRELPLKYGLGYRGGRKEPGDPDPSIVLDLGRTRQLEQIFLVPAQREFLEDPGIFPKRFTIELSNRADFGQRAIVYSSGNVVQTNQQDAPFLVRCNEAARYLRLTVQEGSLKETGDVFALSELLVIAGGAPVSFGARVETCGNLDTPGMWYPQALTDGRTPLGIWHNGLRPHEDGGDSVLLETDCTPVTWTLTLDHPAPIDHLVLFPYQINRSFEIPVVPDAFTVQVAGESPWETVLEWQHPLSGTKHPAPLVIPLHGKPAGAVRITATRPCVTGGRKIMALSEIEVWSGGRNLAKGHGIQREHAGTSTVLHSLSDGFSSEKQIVPVAVWFDQLRERSRIERELAQLRGTRHQLASRSELNASWGSAVVLGLTFLIPVFIVERRRLMSKEQLDQIRKRIASDLHDDIGSNLGSISLIARTARKDLVRLQGPQEIAGDLDEVETIARESSLAMRDIVWLLERRQDSIGDLVQRMRETAGRLLREIHFTLECESTKTTAKLTLDAKRHLFLFYKEAIHNILKHSKANSVSIRLWDEDDKLALEILDNGVGLPMADDQRPANVNKLQDRARVLDGNLQIATAKGDGTRIRLLVKRTNLTHHPAMS